MAVKLGTQNASQVNIIEVKLAQSAAIPLQKMLRVC